MTHENTKKNPADFAAIDAELTPKRQCPECHGTGLGKPHGAITPSCPVCKGSRRVDAAMGSTKGME